jgi:hypothetical protein
MTRWRVLHGLVGSLLLVTSAQAQVTPADGGPRPAASVGAFARLSSGNQKIAGALAQAQAGASSVLDRDDIAALRHAGSSWSDVFQMLKSGGQLQAKSLGEVLSAYERYESRAPVATAILPGANTGVIAIAGDTAVPIVSAASGRASALRRPAVPGASAASVARRSARPGR